MNLNNNFESESHYYRTITGLSEIADRYHVVFCDIWGVIDDGQQLITSAADALACYRKSGGVVVMISNSPASSSSVLSRLEYIGTPPEAFDNIMTSGEVALSLLKQYKSKKIFHIGPSCDHYLFIGLGIDLHQADEADFIVATGFLDDIEYPGEDYQELLATMVARDVEMLCANPDIVARCGDSLVYCVGSLARNYESLGGRVIYVGKPHKEIYDRARELASSVISPISKKVENRSILAIGDGIPTDAAGAKAQGLDFLFITDGIHASEFGELHNPDLKKVRIKLAQSQIKPVAILPSLLW